MSRKPLSPETAVVAPLPSEGGSYVREPDGTLTLIPDSPVPDAPAGDNPEPIPAEEA
jgi:hypothetical protein